MMRRWMWLGGALTLLATWLAPLPSFADSGGVPTAVADFDYADTSGEVGDQTAAHAARMRTFVTLLRERLAAGGHYDVRSISCAQPPCTATRLDADGLARAARDVGAHLLVYGGVHKMSTLIQWGKVQVVDLRTNTLVADRTFSFRGDDDRAFQHAAEFVARYLNQVATTQ